MNELVWYWIGVAGMGAGCVALFFMLASRTKEEEHHTLIHFFVPLLALASYLAMATRQGSMILPTGREFQYARFVDWSVTTPLLLLALSLTAFGGRHKRYGVIAGLLGADIYMIVTGLFSGMTEAGYFMKWVWYGLSSGAFLGIYGVIWGVLRREAAITGGESERLFVRNASILSVVWLAYPFVFLAGPEGLQYILPVTAGALYTVLDLTAKVAYGLLATSGNRAKTTHELAHGLTGVHAEQVKRGLALSHPHEHDPHSHEMEYEREAAPAHGHATVRERETVVTTRRP